VAGRLDGKVCIVTGAGSGIGRATARLFAQQGGGVVAADIDEAGLADTVQGIQAERGRAVARAADVSNPAHARSLADQTAAEFGSIDVLFNNAGIAAAGVLHETPIELWDRIMEVNLRGIFLVSKFVIPHMLPRRAGSIINMSSVIATTGLPNRAAYAASKGGILALTRSMQVDYGPLGIRVNALMPGTIFTPMLERVLQESFPSQEQAEAAIRARQLTTELGRPEDVAWAALFLASEESRFVMASGLVVAGGVSGGKR
jgi:NAD(P)-dependent dehydrogenase (short-subunit alcohol dehydrogenase family)